MASMPDVSFTIGGRIFTLTPDQVRICLVTYLSQLIEYLFWAVGSLEGTEKERRHGNQD